MPEPVRSARLPHVVIIGAGFGGLNAAKALRKAPVRVTLLDRRNHHVFQPLLYQVATAGLSPGEIAYPIRAVVRRQRNTEVWLAEATAIDLEHRRVILADGALDYDYLILAAGARHSYFGHPEWEAIAPGLKDVEDAQAQRRAGLLGTQSGASTSGTRGIAALGPAPREDIRRRILLAFERAEREPDPARRQRELTFAIVGGGPTGVELAGAIADIARRVLVKDFRAIDPREARILLLEGGPRLLPAFPPRLSAKAETMLQQLGVEVRTDALVTALSADSLAVGSETLSAATILWAAGVTASPLARSLGVPLDHAGRVPVQPDLGLPGHPEVFVIGDLATLRECSGQLLPGLAPVALQQGRAAAANILRTLRGQPPRDFRYLDKGNLATIGRARAVADIAGLQLSGLFAWLVWIFVHILYLIGFRNRLLVATEWSWDYLSFQQAARLITGRIHWTAKGGA